MINGPQFYYHVLHIRKCIFPYKCVLIRPPQLWRVSYAPVIHPIQASQFSIVYAGGVSLIIMLGYSHTVYKVSSVIQFDAYIG